MATVKMLLAAAVAAAYTAGTQAMCNNLLKDIKFDDEETGVYQETSLERDFDGYHYFKGLEEQAATIRSFEGSKYLCLKMKQGCVSTHSKRCGIVGKVPITESPSAVTLEYTVRFSSGFDWNKGGKLLGICSGNCPTGCERVDSPSDGFSVRAMWGSGGSLYLYSYATGLETGGKCGNDTFPSTTVHMEPGKDHKIRLIAHMNDIEESNGKLELWLQGQRLATISDVRLRSSEEQGVEDLLFHTFFGGDSDDWAAPKDEEIMYKNIKLYDGDCGGEESAASPPEWTPQISDNSPAGSSLDIKTEFIGSWGGQFCVKYYLTNTASTRCDRYSMDVSMNPSLGYIDKHLDLDMTDRNEDLGWYTFERQSSEGEYINEGFTREGSLCVRNSRHSRFSEDTIMGDFKVAARCDSDSTAPVPMHDGTSEDNMSSDDPPTTPIDDGKSEDDNSHDDGSDEDNMSSDGPLSTPIDDGKSEEDDSHEDGSEEDNMSSDDNVSDDNSDEDGDGDHGSINSDIVSEDDDDDSHDNDDDMLNSDPKLWGEGKISFDRKSEDVWHGFWDKFKKEEEDKTHSESRKHNWSTFYRW